jgi:O-antigen ligase
VLVIPLAFDPDTFDAFALPHLGALVAAATVLAPLLALGGVALPRGRLGRGALGLGAVAAACSVAAAQDPITAILGNEGYRHGLASIAALAVAFLAAMTVAGDDRAVSIVLGAGALGIVLSGVYALLQWQGADPFDWAAPADAVFSTSGNQNDLAMYAVVAVAFAGPMVLARSRRAMALGGLVIAACALQALLSESRAGLAALAVVAVTWAVCAAFRGGAARTKRPLRAGGAVVGAGLALAAIVGGQSSPAAYVEAATGSGSDGGGSDISARLDIWEGALDVALAHPLFGVGPGGLYAEFPRHQPEGLGFPFDRRTFTGNDPLVASPHNLVLEATVSGGIAGLAALVTFMAWIAVSAAAVLRSGWALSAPLIAALAGWLVMAFLNPLPIGSLAVAAVIAGLLAGRSGCALVSFAGGSRARRAITVAATSLPLAAAVVLVALATVAGRETAAAIDASLRVDDAAAADHASRAASIAPFESSIRRVESGALWNLFVTSGERRDLEAAAAQMETLLADFPGLASDYLRLARARYALGLAGVDALLAETERASPNGFETRAALEAFPALPPGEGE